MGPLDSKEVSFNSYLLSIHYMSGTELDVSDKAR